MLAAGALVVLGAFVLPQTAGEVKATDYVVDNLSELQTTIDNHPGSTITLDNLTSVANGENFIINLKGNEVVFNYEVEINSGETLTIRGTGTIIAGSTHSITQIFNVSGGELIIEGGTVSIPIGNNAKGISVSQGTVNMSGGAD